MAEQADSEGDQPLQQDAGAVGQEDDRPPAAAGLLNQPQLLLSPQDIKD